MQDDNLQNEVEQPNPSRRFYVRLSTQARLSILGIALLLAGVLGAVALDRLVPRNPNHDRSFAQRVTWYVHDGQLKADLRTAASVVGYIVSRDSEVAGTALPTNPPVAGKTTVTSPRS